MQSKYLQKPGLGSVITSPGLKSYPHGLLLTPVGGAGGCVGVGVGGMGVGVGGMGVGVGDGVGVGVGLNGVVRVYCTFAAGDESGCNASELFENMWVLALAHERQSISATNIVKQPIQP